MDVHVYVQYVHAYLSMPVYVCACLCVRVYGCACHCMPVCACLWMCMPLYAYYVCLFMDVHAIVCLCILYHIHMYAYVCVCIHMYAYPVYTYLCSMLELCNCRSRLPPRAACAVESAAANTNLSAVVMLFRSSYLDLTDNLTCNLYMKLTDRGSRVYFFRAMPELDLQGEGLPRMPPVLKTK